MAHIVMADDGIEFDGRTPERGPLGGAESAFIQLAETLARRGHKVEIRNRCQAPLIHNGVAWAPLATGLPGRADLFIANRGDRLILAMPQAQRTVFWIHNPARYLLKGRYLWKLWWKKPAIVFLGAYHAGTYPRWAPDGGRVVIPYGVPEAFRLAEPARDPPGPRAIFTSNPMRGLDWLLEVWAEKIRPRVPAAELHVFSGPATYGQAGRDKADRMRAVLDRARQLAPLGVVLRQPVAKAALIEELRQARVMLYKGDVNETYCMALGEAQALGVPAVVQPIGSVVERVHDGETGFVARDATAFADGAVRLLTDAACWRRMHDDAVATQRSWTWDQAAAAFEALIPGQPT